MVNEVSVQIFTFYITKREFQEQVYLFLVIIHVYKCKWTSNIFSQA